MDYQGEPIDVLFLDIELSAENGIDLARELHKKRGSCQIVYLTGYQHYAAEIYHTVHTWFVMKKQFEDRLEDIFHKVLHEMAQKEKKLEFQLTSGKTILLAPEDIQYFERNGRSTRIQTVWGTSLTAERLNMLQKRLPVPEFVRCHNSYIVYLPAVKIYTRNEFIMECGIKISISRSCQGKVKEAFANWASMQIS